MAILLASATAVLELQACFDARTHDGFLLLFLDDAGGPAHPPTLNHTQLWTTCCGHPRHPSLPSPAERCGTRAAGTRPSPAPQNRSTRLRPAPRRLPSGLRRRACARGRARSAGPTLAPLPQNPLRPAHRLPRPRARAHRTSVRTSTPRATPREQQAGGQPPRCLREGRGLVT